MRHITLRCPSCDEDGLLIRTDGREGLVTEADPCEWCGHKPTDQEAWDMLEEHFASYDPDEERAGI